MRLLGPRTDKVLESRLRASSFADFWTSTPPTTTFDIESYASQFQGSARRRDRLVFEQHPCEIWEVTYLDGRAERGRCLRAEEKAADVTLTGSVVDMHCYVTHGLRDAKHTACSNACIARGVPAGFLADDGTLYVLFDEKPFSVKDKVAAWPTSPRSSSELP